MNTDHPIKDSSIISRALELIVVARKRVADLATNIGEEVVFISEARIIKHHAEQWTVARRRDDDFGRT